MRFKLMLISAFLVLPLCAQDYEVTKPEIGTVYVADDGSFELENGVKGKLPWLPTTTEEGYFSKLDALPNRAPAPPLTDLQAFLVRSPSGDENISAYQTTTTVDHDGSFLYIYTYEYGYGQGHYATLDYNQIPNPATWYIVDSANNVIGFIRGWDATTYAGQQDWQAFSVSANSINCCGSRSDQLTIR